MSGIDFIRRHGQHLWLDDISRAMLDSGELQRLHELGVSGVTANPTIYAEAMTESDAYVSDIRARTDHGTEAIFWELAVADLQRAADLFAATFDDSGGLDGLVSLELSPRLAYDQDRTIEAGIDLFARLDRPNAMVKVPGTAAGAGAIEELTARGVNVNVTLLFDLAQWEAAAAAYLRGLERRLDRGEALDVTSVASFFLSRIDVAVNDQLPSEHGNTIAVAAAQLAYHLWIEQQSSDRWRRVEDAGARPQQLLWASTSAKDPSLPETYYAERLVAPDTINTVPRKTLDAIVDSDPREWEPLAATTGQQGEHGAASTIAILEEHGLRFGDVASGLQSEGVEKFSNSFDELLVAIDDLSAGSLTGEARR
jgi:transaldolase